MPTIDLSVTPYLEGNFPSYADLLRATNQILPDSYAEITPCHGWPFQHI